MKIACRGRQAIERLSDLCLPQTVKIAVSIYGNGLFVAQKEGDMRSVLGFEVLAVTAVLGLEIDPLDIVDIHHGVVHGAHIDGDNTVFHGDNGEMFLAAGFHGVGFQDLHGLTAADHGHAGVVDEFNFISAVAADGKFNGHI